MRQFSRFTFLAALFWAGLSRAGLLLATLLPAGTTAVSPVAPGTAAAVDRAAARPAVVILARHAETVSDGTRDPGLSDAGRDRAEALARALADAGLTHVVTSTFKRTRETAVPAAKQAGLEPQQVGISTEGGLAGHVADVVSAVESAGAAGVVLVIGHSNTVPRILHALGGPQLADLDQGDHGGLFTLITRDGGEPALIQARFGDGGSPTAAREPEPCEQADYPNQASSPYVLPYPPGQAHNVRQGNCNVDNSHNVRFNESFAYDFEMPIGSEIVAARGGKVLMARDHFRDDQHGIHEANLVAILHDDGTYAKYGHLTEGGALVETGDRVKTGQPIARSGNSGLSRGPHLHFSVKACPAGKPVGDPACRTIPITFRNTRPHPEGLVGSPTSEIGGGEVYEALPLPDQAPGSGV